MKCPRNNCKNKAVQDSTYGVLPCLKCQKKDSQIEVHGRPEFFHLSKKDRVEHDRDTHAKDILQPWIANKPNRAFYEAYPELRGNYYKGVDLKDMK